MSRDTVGRLAIGVITSIVSVLCISAFAFAWNTNERSAKTETRLDGQAEDIREIKADVKELLKRTAKP